MSEQIISLVAKELDLAESLLLSIQSLFDEGNTIPFIARYRKEHTGGLDEVILAKIEERFTYYKELADRKKTILTTIEKQDKLTDKLKKQIESCFDKYKLEDLYLPYKPKRRTRAQIARELGLEPLAKRILKQEDITGDPYQFAKELIESEKLTISEPEDAIKGALDIVAETICEKSEIRQEIRDLSWREGLIKTRMLVDKSESSGKFDALNNQSEQASNIPSHRMLAIFRGAKEKELSFRLDVDKDEVYRLLDDEVIVNNDSVWNRYMLETIRDAYERLLAPQMETEIRTELKHRADEVAIEVFAENLRVLLLSPPLVGKAVLALDPGLRTGCKVSIIDKTGKFLNSTTAYPLQPKNDIDGTFAIFDKALAKYNIEAIAVGNGTGGKEAFKVARNFIKERNLKDKLIAVMVSEAGASIYSASEIARDEFPDLDLTVRGSISIGRRLQDPLAELVKSDPKSIGVGQYQHDVDQKLLAKKLDDVVEFCVNGVGVDLNTASAPLLSRVAGMNSRVAKNIVNFRVKNGSFVSRKSLLKVPMFGAKTFLQSAGFLRVVGDEPLDNSAVHPERYDLVRKIAKDLDISVQELIGKEELLKKIDILAYQDDEVGEFTIKDIIDELAKPNRDPREDFSVPEFSEDINDIKDLEEGMTLPGVVSNVAKFGAFVDIGVHQDGLIHVSEIDYKFIDDPAKVLKVGDKVTVRVIEIDAARKRISLSRKQAMEPPKYHTPDHQPRQGKPESNSRPPQRRKPNRSKQPNKQQNTKPQKKQDEISSGRFGAALFAALKNDDDK